MAFWSISPNEQLECMKSSNPAQMFRRPSIEFLTAGYQQFYKFLPCPHFLRREEFLVVHGKQLEEANVFDLCLAVYGFEFESCGNQCDTDD